MNAPHTQPPAGGHRRLRRSLQDHILGGVAAGVAEYFAVDVAVVRVGFVVLALAGGMALPLYLAAWVLIPEAGRDTTIADAVLTRVSGRCRGAWTS
jgi:phage shock protein C